MVSNSKTDFRSFKDKIVANRQGYKLKDNSLGSLITQVLLQEEHKRVNPSYTINSFTEGEIFEAGEYFKKRLTIDYLHTRELVSQLVSNALPHKQELETSQASFLPIDEFENLKFLAKRPQSGLHLDEISKHRIQQIKLANSPNQINGGMANSNIHLEVFDESSLYPYLDSKAKKSVPVKMVALGYKSLESTIFKILKTSADLFEMDNETYLNCTCKCPSKPSKKDLIDTLLMYQTSLFSSGEGIYQYHYENGKIKGDIRGPANDIIEKFFGVDFTRARIVTNEKNMNYLQGVFRSHLENSPGFQILVSRDEDFFNNRKKDNSIVLGIEGPKPGCMTEFRLQTLQDFIVGEFGEKSHAFNYKPKEIRNYKPIFKKSKKLKKMGEKLQIMFPEQKIYIQSLFK